MKKTILTRRAGPALALILWSWGALAATGEPLSAAAGPAPVPAEVSLKTTFAVELQRLVEFLAV